MHFDKRQFLDTLSNTINIKFSINLIHQDSPDQKVYIQLKHISSWQAAVVCVFLWNWPKKLWVNNVCTEERKLAPHFNNKAKLKGGGSGQDSPVQPKVMGTLVRWQQKHHHVHHSVCGRWLEKSDTYVTFYATVIIHAKIFLLSVSWGVYCFA